MNKKKKKKKKRQVKYMDEWKSRTNDEKAREKEKTWWSIRRRRIDWRTALLQHHQHHPRQPHHHDQFIFHSFFFFFFVHSVYTAFQAEAAASSSLNVIYPHQFRRRCRFSRSPLTLAFVLSQCLCCLPASITISLTINHHHRATKTHCECLNHRQNGSFSLTLSLHIKLLSRTRQHHLLCAHFSSLFFFGINFFLFFSLLLLNLQFAIFWSLKYVTSASNLVTSNCAFRSKSFDSLANFYSLTHTHTQAKQKCATTT